ncbi:AAA family ATPase [Ralstonia pseudosolanacearum]|uniref:AAA family ATPase n=1 Tax=Ralstonia pseudosolanacearum TaxID=1310165 RepID=UPI00399B9748
MNAPTEIMRGVLANAERIRKPEPVRDGVILVNGADLKPQPVRWLWRDWLALGKLHILAGAPGQGKTTIALAFAATVTSGGRWPDGSRCEPGNVLVWSGEDDPADTLLPRLLAAGGDRGRVYFVAGSRVNGEVESFDPARDMATLQAEAERIGNVRLLIVDPVVSAVAGDSHKNTETRRALQPLVDLAASMGAAVVGITHFSKGGQGSDPTQRVVGSVAFTAVARVVLVAAKVKSEDGEDRRIVARSKSNIGPDEGGFEYRLEQSEPLPDILASYVAWGASVAGTARELLTDPEEQDDGEVSAKDAAIEFLQEVLGDDVVPMKAIEAEAKEAGIAWRTVRRAADALGVKSRKGEGGKWYWCLPKVANMANLSNVETMDTLATLTAPVNQEGNACA